MTCCSAPTAGATDTTGTRAGSRPRRRRRIWTTEQLDLTFEIRRVLEGLVHTGEPERGNGIEGAKTTEHRFADLTRIDLAPVGRQTVLDRHEQRSDLGRTHGPPLARCDDPGFDLVPIEGLTAPVTLDDDRKGGFEAFEGGEACAARVALTSTPDG